jgi:hypothetical protein
MLTRRRRRRRIITIGKVRSLLYFVARILGDISAIRRGPRAIGKRIGRRIVGRITGRAIGRMFR